MVASVINALLVAFALLWTSLQCGAVCIGSAYGSKADPHTPPCHQHKTAPAPCPDHAITSHAPEQSQAQVALTASLPLINEIVPSSLAHFLEPEDIAPPPESGPPSSMILRV